MRPARACGGAAPGSGDVVRRVLEHRPPRPAAARARPAARTGPDAYAGPEPHQRLGDVLEVPVARASGAARTRRARRARPATPAPRTCAGRCGRTGACRARAAGPPPAAGDASSRCTPSDRPTRPICTNRSMKSGFAVSSSENSSHTMSSVGSGPSGIRRPGPLVVVDRREVAGPPQQLLPAQHLAVDRVGHAVDQRQLVGEVGDHGGDVRQPVERDERGAALVVDQHEVQVLRRVRGGQPEHQRAQQFGLARAGRADHQPVRAHAVQRRLLQVELDRLAVGADADRHPQPVARRAGRCRRRRRTRPGRRCRAVRRGRWSRRSGASPRAGAGEPARCQPAHQRLRLDPAQRRRAGRRRRRRPGWW